MHKVHYVLNNLNIALCADAEAPCSAVRVSPKLHRASPKLRDGEGGGTSYALRRRQAFGGRWKAQLAQALCSL